MKLALISLNAQDSDPPLGLAYLSSYIKKYSGHKVKIIDKEDILKAVTNDEFDVIGISAMNSEFRKAVDLAEKIKKISNAKLIIGGVHISLMPEHLKESPFEIGFIGESENTIVELLNVYSEKGSLDEEELIKINGLVYKKKDGELGFSPPRELIKDLDTIPYPDRDALKMKDFYLLLQTKAGVNNVGIFTTMFTSRGCPYNCSFCSSIRFWGRKIRYHSPEYVVGEIELLVKKYKVEGIHIFDDLFVADKNRVKKIVELLESKGLTKKVRFSLLARTDMITEELLVDLKRMNVTHLGFGFESASPKVLTYLKGAGIKVENHKKAIELCKKYGIYTTGSFMIGNPYETKEDIRMTLDFIKNNPLDQVNINQLVPMPKTNIWEYAKEQGLVDDSYNFAINNLSDVFVHRYNPSMIVSQEMTTEEFKTLFDEAQQMVTDMKHEHFVMKLSYLKYLKDWRTVKKLFKRWKRVLMFLGFADDLKTKKL